MHFSLDLINFSGVDSLHMFFLAVLFAVLIRIKAVPITLSVVAGIPRRLAKRPQAVSLIRSQAECALRMRKYVIFRIEYDFFYLHFGYLQEDNQLWE